MVLVVLRRFMSGGNVGTWTVDLGLILPTPTIEPTDANIAAISNGVINALRTILPANGIDTGRPYRATFAVHYGAGGNRRAEISHRLNEVMNSPVILTAAMTQLIENSASSQESDTITELDSSTFIKVTGYPTDLGQRASRRGGCLDDIHTDAIGNNWWWSPPTNTNCLVYCLAHAVFKSKTPAKISNFRRNPEKHALDLDMSFTVKFPGSDVQDPDDLVPKFHELGYKLRIAIDNERFYGDPAWPTHYFALLGKHFVVVKNPEASPRLARSRASAPLTRSFFLRPGPVRPGRDQEGQEAQAGNARLPRGRGRLGVGQCARLRVRSVGQGVPLLRPTFLGMSAASTGPQG